MKDGAAVLDTAGGQRAPANARKPTKAAGRSAATPAMRRDLGEDFAPRRRAMAPTAGLGPESLKDDQEYAPRRSFGSMRFRVRGGIPKSVVGRVLAGGVALALLGGGIFGLWELREALLTNPRLVLASSSGIQVSGNNHLTRAQLLSVFGEDVDRNVLTVSLAERRAELERLPWVEHATVMRLLPNRFRVAIVERKPVAFVRQGSSIGLVDANGVLLDMASNGDSGSEAHYSFPVVTGIAAADPLSVRAARMKLFGRFLSDLGGNADKISEVDLSNPEDVKALVPEGGSDILVHFGEDDFLHRYELFEKNLPGWKTQFPHMASADMRYERQVVLEMQPNTAVPVSDGSAAEEKPAAAAPKPAVKAPAKPKPAAKGAAKHPGRADAEVPLIKPAATPPLTTAALKAPELSHPGLASAPAAPKPVPVTMPAQHLTTSFDVGTKPAAAVKSHATNSQMSAKTQAAPQ